MAQVKTLQARIIKVDTKTIHPPQFRDGTKRRISTKNAKRLNSNVGKLRMRRARRYLEE